jgi:2-succinyl-6-hydroxy-2,4-cyclohexadiene-1-carboxylate synthase
MIPRRVVLLHGFTQGGGIWVPVMEAVTTRAPIDAPDLPGHGSSSEIAMGLPETADLLAHEYGLGAYVGYSMGGRLALHLALAHPHLVSHLVLCSATAGIEDPDDRSARRQSDDALANHIRNVGVDTFLTEWLAQPMFTSLTVTTHDAEVRAANTAVGLARSLELSGTGTQEPLWDRLHTLQMPVLIVTGERDKKFTALGRRVVESIGDNARHVEVPDAGHALPFERPLDFAALLSAFLR